ncbi:MAG: hypothetical protein JWO47_255 [Candidatus Saccharibacteria bacterium]|nr:hypothetical protein [Candidatus Saccharibacteria bacterium]
MLTFIVLGYIPGTHAQLTFNMLLLVVTAFMAPFIIVKLAHFIAFHHRTHQLFLDIVSI